MCFIEKQKKHQIKIPSSSHPQINKPSICQTVFFSPVAEELSPLLQKANSFQRFLRNSYTALSTPFSITLLSVYKYLRIQHLGHLHAHTCTHTHTHTYPYLEPLFPASNYPFPLLYRQNSQFKKKNTKKLNSLHTSLCCPTIQSTFTWLPNSLLHPNSSIKIISELYVAEWNGCFSVFISLDSLLFKVRRNKEETLVSLSKIYENTTTCRK